MIRRRRFKQVTTLKERLIIWANEVREKANQLAPGPEREGLLKKARQTDTASHIEDWANSYGLRPPK